MRFRWILHWLLTLPALASSILIEAESFRQRGGWVIDQQSMDQMGSPYLLAHGLGRPVTDAMTNIEIPETGKYRIRVRTRDWVAPWKKTETPPAMRAVGTPGRFQLLIDGEALKTTFGTVNAEWHWQDGGVVELEKGEVTLSLHDLTGFEGRCDAILLSTDHKLVPPNRDPEMAEFRLKLLGYPEKIPDAGKYDLVVVGGGLAGTCAAICAARQGCKVALIQNRPVLGGNNSSEVRVGMSGGLRLAPYPKLGAIVQRVAPQSGRWPHNGGPSSAYEDQKKEKAVRAEPNISLFLNTHINAVEMDGKRIVAVIGQCIRSGKRLRFKGKLFADCTGDANLGFLAKADFRVGREAKSETQEELAPLRADKLLMGTSVQWYSKPASEPDEFPLCPWAIRFNRHTCVRATRGDWNWETGARRDQVSEIEHIRDYAFRVIYGNWSVLKNDVNLRHRYRWHRLAWVAYIGGKRESRRLLGDLVLRQQDIVTQRFYPDACVTTTWPIDLHYPLKPAGGIEPFQSEAKNLHIRPYPIPYRCFYSRNVTNLFMAGRNISVTHVALGTVRVMRTTGMMGEVVGFAAGICRKNSCTPRDVYTKHLAELKEALRD